MFFFNAIKEVLFHLSMVLNWGFLRVNNLGEGQVVILFSF
jgi:hypothetical protein